MSNTKKPNGYYKEFGKIKPLFDKRDGADGKSDQRVEDSRNHPREAPIDGILKGQRSVQRPKCPWCHSVNVDEHDDQQDNGRKYRCDVCSRTFNELWKPVYPCPECKSDNVLPLKVEDKNAVDFQVSIYYTLQCQDCGTKYAEDCIEWPTDDEDSDPWKELDESELSLYGSEEDYNINDNFPNSDRDDNDTKKGIDKNDVSLGSGRTGESENNGQNTYPLDLLPVCTVVQLKSLCKELKINGYSRKNKAQLLSLIADSYRENGSNRIVAAKFYVDLEITKSQRRTSQKTESKFGVIRSTKEAERKVEANEVNRLQKEPDKRESKQHFFSIKELEKMDNRTLEATLNSYYQIEGELNKEEKKKVKELENIVDGVTIGYIPDIGLTYLRKWSSESLEKMNNNKLTGYKSNLVGQIKVIDNALEIKKNKLALLEGEGNSKYAKRVSEQIKEIKKSHKQYSKTLDDTNNEIKKR